MRRLVLALFVLLPLVAFARVGGPPVASAGAPTDLALALDCDVAAPGTQTACVVHQDIEPDVHVVLTNLSLASIQLGSFNFTVFNPDDARLHALFMPSDLLGHSGNPDLDPGITSPSWACNAPPPDNDTMADANPATQESLLQCFNGNADGIVLAPGASAVLARIDYVVSPPSALPGTVALSIQGAVVRDESGTPRGECPVLSTPMTCSGATITLPEVTMSVDCNTTLAGVQSSCWVSNMASTRDVDIVVRNISASSYIVGAAAFTLLNPDNTRLFAPPVSNPPPPYDNGNPDAHADLVTSADWACGPANPDNDTDGDADPATQQSFLSCFTGTPTTTMIAAGATLRIATVHYNIPPGADVGSMSLSVEDAAFFDGVYVERGSCNPTVGVEMLCNSATVNFYCPIDLADVSGDNWVNILDVYMTALQQGVLPAPAQYDQNFDGVINVADRGIVASYRNKPVSLCP